MARTIRLLIIDDDPIQRATYRSLLEGDGDAAYQVIEASDCDEGTKLVRDGGQDCVLLDYSLPGRDGLEVLAELGLEEQPDHPPIVMLTGYGSEDVAVRAMKLGCEDYLSKERASDAESLRRVIRNAVERGEMRRALLAQEAELERSRQRELDLKDEFLSHVSHELRTPLTAIHQFVSLLLEDGADPLSDEQRQFLEISARNVDQLRDMINDLMEVTRARSGKLRIDSRPADVGALFRDMALTFRDRAAERSVAFEARLPEEMPPVVADESRIRQMLGNLLENALKYTPDEGSVALRVQPDPGDDGMLRVTVSDTGPGIDAESVEQIFFRLHQQRDAEYSSRRGLGLGLFICRELAERQGGRIWVESELGHGSEFHFTLPLFVPARMLRPALVADGELRSEFGRLRLTLQRAPGRASVPDRACRSALHLLRATAFPADVVMSVNSVPDGGAAFEVIVGGDAVGLSSLEARVRDALAQCRELIDTRTGWEIDSRIEKTQSDDRALDERVAEIADRLAEVAAPLPASEGD